MSEQKDDLLERAYAIHTENVPDPEPQRKERTITFKRPILAQAFIKYWLKRYEQLEKDTDA